MSVGKELTNINSSSKTKGQKRTKMASPQMCVSVYSFPSYDFKLTSGFFSELAISF